MELKRLVAFVLIAIMPAVVVQPMLAQTPAAELRNEDVIRKLAAHANSAHQGTITRSELEDSARTLAAYRQSEAGTRNLKQMDTILLLNPERFQRALSGREISRLFTRLQTAGYTGDLGGFTQAMQQVNRDRVRLYQYIVEHGVQHALWQLEHQYHSVPIPVSYVPSGLLPLATVFQLPVFGFFGFWNCDTLGFASKAVLFVAGTAAVVGQEEIAMVLGFAGGMGEFIHYVYC